MVQNCNQARMLNKPIPSLLVRMTLPLVPAILLLLGFDLLESYLVAKTSTTALVALGFSAPITTTMVAIAIANSIATNNIICQTQSTAKQALKAKITNVLWVTTVLVFLLTIVFLVSSSSIFGFLGVQYASIPQSYHLGPKPNLLPMVIEYSDLRLVGWIFMAFFWQVNGILRSLGQIKLASVLLCLWMISKSVLAYYLISYSQQEQGSISSLQASAYAHLISDALFAGFSLIYLNKTVGIGGFRLKQISWDNTLKQLSAIGLSATFQQCLLPLSIALLTATVAFFGADKVALLGLIFRLEAMSLLLPMAFTASLPGLIACNWWAGNTQRVKSILHYAFFSVLVSQIIIAGFLFTLAPWVSSMLISDSGLQYDFQQYLRWVPFSFVGAGCAMVAISCFNALGWSADGCLLGSTHRIGLMLSLTLIGSWYAGIIGFFIGVALAHLLILPFVYYFIRDCRITHKFELSKQYNEMLEQRILLEMK
jgi:Na+-driven multidrug efflux pump